MKTKAKKKPAAKVKKPAAGKKTKEKRCFKEYKGKKGNADKVSVLGAFED